MGREGQLQRKETKTSGYWPITGQVRCCNAKKLKQRGREGPTASDVLQRKETKTIGADVLGLMVMLLQRKETKTWPSILCPSPTTVAT